MTANDAGGLRALGTLRAEGREGVVRLEDRFDTHIDDLWAALTDPDRLQRWLGVVNGERAVDEELQAHFFASGWEGTIRVVACEQPRHLLLATAAPDQPDGVMEVTLTPEGDTTLLVVEDRGMPLDQIAAYGAGDQVHLEDLAAYLAGRDRCDARMRWQELDPVWQALADGLE